VVIGPSVEIELRLPRSSSCGESLRISGLVPSLAVLVPGLAVSWRRLHDTNHRGALSLLALIPIVGPIIVLVLLLLPTNPEGARFDR
jgi:uncharacterized membrane protein YhaH (DUF805 family)